MTTSGRREPLAYRLFFTTEEGESGYTTLGMVIALLVSLSLVFTCAQVYRLSTVSAAIQDVADAAALAAENQVGQFMVAVRVCDALVLSLSLTSLASTGLGVAALCTPVTSSVAPALIEAGKNIASARNSFSKGAVKVLNAYQETLPFLSAASAWNVAKKNNDTAGSSDYLALAILVPWSGENIEIDENDEIEQAQQAVDEGADDLREDGEKAEEAATKANEAKQRAYQADCGNNPGYCMYERAVSLALLGGAENPLYTSVDAWSFSVALKRATAYYQKRFQGETPDGQSVEEQGRSALRKNVYRYACEEFERGYVNDTGDSFSSYFPLLPRNTAEMRESTLYTEAIYPMTQNEEGDLVLHSYASCPKAVGVVGFGSVSEMEEGEYPTCSACGFTASLLGSVCSASSSIENGFEYHYRIVAEAAQEYEKAREELDPIQSEVKREASSLFDELCEAFEAVRGYRIDVSPAGSLGVITLVVDLSQTSGSEGFETSFVQTDTMLGTRAAVSGATLLADASDDQNSVITQVLEGIEDQASSKPGILAIVLECWNAFLYAYGEGQDAITGGIEHAVNAIPFASESGLGTWAAKTLKKMVEGLGLQPANCDSLKPVIVNTGLVAEESSEGFAVRYLAVKQGVLKLEGGTELFSAVVSDIESNLVEKVSGEFELATIKPLGDGGPSIPITIALPSAAQEASTDLISQVANAVRGVLPKVGGENVWR